MQSRNRRMIGNFQKLRKDTIFLNKILYISKENKWILNSTCCEKIVENFKYFTCASFILIKEVFTKNI